MRIVVLLEAFLTSLVLAAPVAAQVVTTPAADRPNTAAVTAEVPDISGGVIRSTYYPAVLGQTAIAVAHDATVRTLAFDAIDVRLGSGVAGSLPFSYCYQNQRFHLPAGVRPVTATDLDGHFTIVHDAVFEYEVAPVSLRCAPGAFGPGSVPVVWHATGRVRHDAATSALYLEDLNVAVEGTGAAAAATLLLNLSSGFHISGRPETTIEVGSPLVFTGVAFTPGTVAKVFINTADGPRDVVPEGLRPTSVTPLRWEGQLPWPWPLPAPGDQDIGVGFLSVHLIRTDVEFQRSNEIPFVLTGSSASGIPALTSLTIPLSPTSLDPRVAVPNVERVFLPGELAYAGGFFAHPTAMMVNVFGATGNCAPAGGVTPNVSGETWLSFVMPTACPVGPGAIQVVDTVTGRASNIISAPIGELMDIASVTISGTEVRVAGTGFNRLTAVNFFAHDGAGALANFGGYDAAGRPRLAVTVMDARTLRFELPVGVMRGACFVEALNPPFISYTSSRTRLPGGECTVP